MRHFVICCILVLFAANVSNAFEIDGLKSGMSMDQAKQILQDNSYKNTEIKDNSIIAYSKNDSSRLGISLSFCEGKLVWVEKYLGPSFDNFARLIHEKTRALGKPIDTSASPSNELMKQKISAVSFLWRDAETFVKVTYTEIDFCLNSRLKIIYAIENECKGVP